MNLFLFGTLRHGPLLDVVAGQAGLLSRSEPAFLAGVRVAAVTEGDFPVLAEDAEGAAEGILLRDVPEAALARLDYYEASYGYERFAVRLRVADVAVSAFVYRPPAERFTPAGDWDLAAWEAARGRITAEAAAEAMTLHANGAPGPVFVNAFNHALARASARARARGRRPDVVRSVEVMEQGDPYTGFFGVRSYRLRHETFAGGTSPVLDRAIWMSADAALVLPYDPVRDRVLLIEQFRVGPFNRDDPDPWLLEPVAGRVDAGETPEEAARREAQEEAGLALSRLEVVAEGYPSPGTTSEHFYIYVGLADLPEEAGGIGGLASEAEDIRAFTVSWEEFLSMLDGGAFRLVPLQLAGHWLARHRERLRASA